MKNFDKRNSLFIELEKHPPEWWELIKSDSDLYIDIRKGNYIDVYYNGGGIIKKLKHNGKNYCGEVHYKYLLPEKSSSLKYVFKGDLLELPTKSPQLLLGILDPKSIKRIKDNIRWHYPNDSEKGIQSKFVTNKLSCFIDSEFADNNSNDKLRIDLVWIDKNNCKIIIVELKSIKNGE